mmetsp:Transcript_120655/g.341155  ORF Transcript_120655/g.341155 Transcript_120655/m.341155 type:complete len:456 (+) Transcript_120655:43-1410(+)
MAPVDITFYTRLGVEPTATLAEIKSAYRRKALLLHPDKGGCPEEFGAMKAAYDVLSKPEKRQIYDRYGPEVIEMMNGSVRTPAAVILAMSRVGMRERAIALLLILTASSVLLSPAVLTALRWDHRVTMSWYCVAIPFWIFEVALLIVIFFWVTADRPDDIDSSQEARATAAERKRMLNKFRCCFGIAMSLLIIFEILVIQKLQGTLGLSWSMVLLPCVLLEAYFLMIRACSAKASWAQSDPAAAATLASLGRSPTSSTSFHYFLLRNLQWGVMRCLTVLLVAARADGKFAGSWLVCTIPAAVCGLLSVVAAVASRCASTAGRADEGREAGEAPPTRRGEVFVVTFGVALWLAMWVLAAGKLDGGHYSAFVVFIPLFVSVFAVTCLFSCIVALLGPEDLAAEMAGRQADPQGCASRDGFISPNYGATSVQAWRSTQDAALSREEGIADGDDFEAVI